MLLKEERFKINWVQALKCEAKLTLHKNKSEKINLKTLLRKRGAKKKGAIN